MPKPPVPEPAPLSQTLAAPSPPPRTEAQASLGAIGLLCLACMCFSVLDASAKWLSPQIGVLETTFVRYGVSFLIVSAILNPVTRPGVLRTRRPLWQALRSLALLGSTLCNFLALEHLQLAQTMAIMFLHPLVVALLAGPILGEWVGLRRLVAIIVGFLGVLVVVRPGFGGIHPAAVFSFLAVLFNGAYTMITRMLAAHDSSATTMVYSAVAGAVLLLPMMPSLMQAPFSPVLVFGMVLVGAAGSIGHWLLILAHRHAAASALAPFTYSQIVWMVLLGYFLFGDVPDGATLAGGAIVIASGLYLIHRERIVGPRRALLAEDGKAASISR